MKFNIYDNDEKVKELDASTLEKSADGTYSWVYSNLAAGSKHSISVSADNGEGEGERSAAIDVTTGTVGVTSITLTIGKTAHVGDMLTATVTIQPPDATDKTVTYSVDNKSVATVNNDGKLACLAPGTVTLTATASNGESSTATIAVYEVMINVINVKASNVTATSATISWQTEKAG